MSGHRRRLSAASFGPEWAPFGNMAGWLLDKGSHRDQTRLRAYLRDARRELSTLEAIYDKPASRGRGAP